MTLRLRTKTGDGEIALTSVFEVQNTNSVLLKAFSIATANISQQIFLN